MSHYADFVDPGTGVSVSPLTVVTALRERIADLERQLAEAQVTITTCRQSIDHYVDLYADALDERDTLKATLEQVRGALEGIKRECHPKGPGWGCCPICRKAGGQHSETCVVSVCVNALVALDP